MKLQITRILKDELARLGEPLPLWIDTFLYVINQFIDNVGKCLKGQVTFSDNIACKIMKVDLTHNIEYVVNPTVLGTNISTILGSIPVLAVNKAGNTSHSYRNVITGFGVNLKSNGEIGIVAQFAEGKNTICTTTFVILFA